jgi:hypothetical protein
MNWLAHPMIHEMARDPIFRSRLVELRNVIIRGEDVSIEDAADILHVPLPALAAIFVEHVLTEHPDAVITIDIPPINPNEVN